MNASGTPGRGGHLLPRNSQVPQFNEAVLTPRGQGLAIRREGHAVHVVGVPAERADLFPRGHIP